MKTQKGPQNAAAEARGGLRTEAEKEETGETTIHELDETSFWPRTIWPEVHAAAGEIGKSPERLNELILRYERPLRIYLLHQFGAFPEIKRNADDLLQGFASRKILSERWLGKASPQKGRFRDYLKRSLKNYVIDWGRSVRPPSITLDELVAAGREPAAPEPPQESFDFTFVQDVLTEALERVERDCKDPKRRQPRSSQIWELFRIRLLDPIFKETQPEPYERLQQRFGLRSPTEGTNMLLSAKRLFKRHLADVITEYEGSDEAAKTELARLTQFVSELTSKR
jgi:hypothetical protein